LKKTLNENQYIIIKKIINVMLYFENKFVPFNAIDRTLHREKIHENNELKINENEKTFQKIRDMLKKCFNFASNKKI